MHAKSKLKNKLIQKKEKGFFFKTYKTFVQIQIKKQIDSKKKEKGFFFKTYKTFMHAKSKLKNKFIQKKEKGCL